MGRPLGQMAVGVAFWLLFALLWVDVVRDGNLSSPDLVSNALYVAGIAVAVLVVNLAWIIHNILIFRRKGPRGAAPETLPRTDKDRLNRSVVWDLPGRRAGAVAGAHLVVTIENGVKTYRNAAAQPDG